MLTLAWVGLVLCFLVWVVSRALPRVDRVIALFEASRVSTPTQKRDPIPLDLVLSAKAYGSEWARDAALKSMEEAYERFGSWDAVRSSIPPTVGDE